MAVKLRDRIAKHKEAIRAETLEILTTGNRPFDQRIIDLICGHELPSYDWVTNQAEDVERNDKRLKLLRKIATNDMAVFLHKRISDYGPFGNGIIVCQLDADHPWSVAESVNKQAPTSMANSSLDVVLRAHPKPGTAVAFLHRRAEIRDYVAGTDVFESPEMVNVTMTDIEVMLPDVPVGVENFASRLQHLGSVAGYGARGILELSSRVAKTDNSPEAHITLLHAALRHYSGDDSWRYA